MPILHIEPRWETTSWSGKTIGAAIPNAPETWKHFFIHAAGRVEN